MPCKPTLRLGVYGTSQVDGHTVYDVKCSLAVEEPQTLLSWTVHRRLSHLRTGLHDLVKSELGRGYAKVFSDAPFAKMGSWTGASQRLQKWMGTLAACVNSGVVTPALLARILLFLEAPVQSTMKISAA